MFKRLRGYFLNSYMADSPAVNKKYYSSLFQEFLQLLTPTEKIDFINSHRSKLMILISKKDRFDEKLVEFHAYVAFVSCFTDQQLELIKNQQVDDELCATMSLLINKIFELTEDLSQSMEQGALSQQVFALAGYTAWLTVIYHSLIYVSPVNIWWSHCYNVFLTIHEQGWSDIKSPFKPLTMKELFARILLLSISVPHSYPLNKHYSILMIVNSLAEHVDFAPLTAEQITLSDEDETILNEYCFSRHTSHPPCIIDVRNIHSDTLVIKTDILKKVVLEEIKQASLKKNASFDIPLFSQLLASWIHPTHRKAPRFSTKKDNEQTSVLLFSSADTHGHRELLERLFAGEQLPESDYCLDAKVINISASGIQLEMKEVNDTTVQPSDILLALDAGQWNLGVVRWVSAMDHNRFRYGIEWFGKKMRVVSVELKTSAGHQFHKNALHFSNSNKETQEKIAVLVYDQNFNRLSRPVEIIYGEEHKHLKISYVRFKMKNYDIVDATYT